MQFLRPILNYACPTWGHLSDTYMRRMQAFQSRCLRFIVDAPWGLVAGVVTSPLLPGVASRCSNHKIDLLANAPVVLSQTTEDGEIEGTGAVVDMLVKELEFLENRSHEVKKKTWTRKWVLRHEELGASVNFLHEVEEEDKDSYKNNVRLISESVIAYHLNYSSPMASLVLTDSSQLTSDSQHLDFSYHQVHKVMTKHKFLLNKELTRIKQTVAALKEFNISQAEIREQPDVLSILPVTIQNHGMVLKEGGFISVTPWLLLNYQMVVKKRVSLLKAHGYIPTNVDPVASVQSYLGDLKPSPIPSGDSFLEAHKAALRQYLMWRLEMSPEEIDGVFKTYIRIKHKSVRLIRRSLDILEHDIGLTKEKHVLPTRVLTGAVRTKPPLSTVRPHVHLTASGHPDNTLDTLRLVETLGGLPTRQVFRMHPKIIMTTTETLLRTKQFLEEHGISDEAARRCFDIFTLSSDSVNTRLKELSSIPAFNALQTHPRVLRLVHYQQKARSRLDYLRDIRVKCASLHILCSSQKKFQKYAKEGADKTRGRDITGYLSMMLGLPEIEIRQGFHRHPYWCHIPLHSVKDTLHYLLELGFTREQVWSNVHLLVYPRQPCGEGCLSLQGQPANKLLNQQRNIQWKLILGEIQWKLKLGEIQGTLKLGEIQGLQTVSGGLVVLESELSGSQRLAMCLYFIEKEFHFTGDGVWTDQATPSLSNEVSSIEASQ
uniref:Uncharacterized protein n=1 Tax=Timema genevievae TaxID=629358 RepID=A0A7R9JZE4_TIMGE|nr:unnamed protein product [Timema genevievae]